MWPGFMHQKKSITKLSLFLFKNLNLKDIAKFITTGQKDPHILLSKPTAVPK